jgi:hypothetical protein
MGIVADPRCGSRILDPAPAPSGAPGHCTSLPHHLKETS